MDRGRRWPCPVSVFCRRTTCPSCLARVVSSFSELPIRQPSQAPPLTVLSRTLAQVPAMASAHYAVNASSSASSLLDPAQPTAWDARTLGGSVLALVVTLLIAEQVRPCLVLLRGLPSLLLADGLCICALSTGPIPVEKEPPARANMDDPGHWQVPRLDEALDRELQGWMGPRRAQRSQCLPHVRSSVSLWEG